MGQLSQAHRVLRGTADGAEVPLRDRMRRRSENGEQLSADLPRAQSQGHAQLHSLKPQQLLLLQQHYNNNKFINYNNKYISF